VIRGTTAHGEYRIGLNNNTMSSLVAAWSNPQGPQVENRPEVSGPNEDKPVKARSAKGDNVGSTATLHIDSPEPSKAIQTQPVKNGTDEKNSQTKQPAKANVASNATDKTPVKEANPDEAHWLDPKLFEQFKSLAKANLKQQLSVTINEKVVPIESIKFGPPPRHPFYLTLSFEFQVPDSGSFEIQVQDNGFEKMTGAVRYALKAHGQMMVLKSNVAPTIIRAERIEMEGLTNELRKAQTTISTRIGVASSKGTSK